MSEQSLPDGVAVVTGATGSMGQATARALREAGWPELLLSDLSADALEKELISHQPREVEQIILKGDANARHETIVRVLDACAKAGHICVSVEVKKD